ncbi:hypothetical protein [Isoptericola croceus]|uniref:hypothetical protein n=1 Tax=Isoptericola croceus TaxID=3031406 RepID=UPI0023F65E3B|nr:hypothetical protein [Isoptericola croceus]
MIAEERSTPSKIARAVGLTVTYAVAGLVGMIIAGLLALPEEDVQQALVLRAVVVGALLVLVTLLTDRRRPLPVLLGVAFASYALNPATWIGRAFLAQLWFEPGVATVLVDGAAWLGVVAGTVWLKRAAGARAR